MRLILLCSLSLLSPLAAQTIVVSGGGTALALAASTAPDGAVLVVQSGTYDGFTMSGKGLAILGDPGVMVSSAIVITNTQPHQPLTLRGLTWTTTSVTFDVLRIADCAGPVLLESLAMPPNGTCLPGSPFGYCFRSTGVRAARCAQLTLRSSSIRCTVNVESCDTVVESCLIEGENWFPVSPGYNSGRTALWVTLGSVQISGASTMRGGDGYPNGPAAALAGDGIFSSGGSVRVLDGQVLGGRQGALPGYTIRGTNGAQVSISPRVTLAGDAGPMVGTDVMPELVGSSAPLGGTVHATVTTENGDLVILVLGLPGPAISVPGIAPPFWIDPVVHLFHTVAAQQSGAPITGTIPVPNDPGLLGFRLNWQAACFGPVTGSQATNPIVTLVF